jgi:hypothetical protein
MHNRSALCWSFLCVNNNGKVTLDAPQIMHCMLSYSNYIYIYICNLRKKLRKGLIFYYKTSGITCLRKHIDANHSIELLKKTN